MDASREISRLRYLQAMGVPVYVTRRPLPGAALSPKYALRHAGRAVDLASRGGASRGGAPAPERGAEPAVQKASPPAAQALRESLRQDLDRPKPARNTASHTAANPAIQAAPGQDPSPRFRLAAVICKGRLWLEELGEEALAQDQLQLVSAMARALEHPAKGEASVAVTEFRWPLHDNAQLGLSVDDATAALQGFLSRQLEENACVELICLGDASKTLLTGLSIPCARRALPSSRAMLETPSVKRDAWKALRA